MSESNAPPPRLSVWCGSHTGRRRNPKRQTPRRETSAGLPIAIEPLEGRVLLSTFPATAFVSTHLQTTIYVNQFGDALLPGRRISKPGQSQFYAVYFDDSGYLRFGAKGSLRTQVAYYAGGRGPTLVDLGTDKNGYGQLKRIWVGPDKQMLYLGVKAADPHATGTYDLFVAGVRHNVIYRVDVSPDNNFGTAHTDISGDNDADFYAFTTTRAGDWNVTLSPDRHLDATIVVFDSAGNPLAGSFTSTVNQGGVGVPETWLGHHLPAGTTYYVRVDGKGASTGDYSIQVQGFPLPEVSVAASAPTASKATGQTGQFTISRSADADQSAPLKVAFRLGGTAKMGIDYKPINAFVTIPADQSSATVTITPILNKTIEPVRMVVLDLLASDAYTIATGSAKVTIAGAR